MNAISKFKVYWSKRTELFIAVASKTLFEKIDVKK